MVQTARTPLNELDKFMGGALQERVGHAIGDVVANIFDPNTEASKPRKVKIEIIIKPNKNRKSADVITMVTTSLQPLKQLETSADIGYDKETGELVMTEQSDIAPGQKSLLDESEFAPNVARFPSAAQNTK